MSTGLHACPTVRPALAILGTRGIPAQHGGFETFAEHLALFLVSRGWQVTVYCQTDGQHPARETWWHGVRLVHIGVQARGALGTMQFDWKATQHAARAAPLVLTLGYNTAVFLLWYRLRGVTNLINMDGLEWRRSKWGTLAKAWLYLNERAAIWWAHHLIADSPGIRSHLLQHASGRNITMIPYGADAVHSADADVLDELGLQRNGYALIIARPEPENSILELIQAFVAVPRDCQLVVLGKWEPDTHRYHRDVLALATRHANVLLPGPIYNKTKVAALRFHARVYLHGHQVGGTNPSLVEALAAGNACLAHDNVFNRWVGGDAALYFSETASCATLMTQLLGDAALRSRMQAAARARHESEFTWDTVLAQYDELLSRWCARTRPLSLPSP